MNGGAALGRVQRRQPRAVRWDALGLVTAGLGTTRLAMHSRLARKHHRLGRAPPDAVRKALGGMAPPTVFLARVAGRLDG